MPRDLLRQVLDENIRARGLEINGRTITPFVLTPYDPAGTLMPVADVEISGVILSGIPLSPQNRELQNILPGTPVKMTRSRTGRLEVTGVNKRGGTATYIYSFRVPQITPLVSGSTSALSPGSLTSMGTVGFETRKITFGELATNGLSGFVFGVTPLEATLLIDLEGNITKIL